MAIELDSYTQKIQLCDWLIVIGCDRMYIYSQMIELSDWLIAEAGCNRISVSNIITPSSP